MIEQLSNLLEYKELANSLTPAFIAGPISYLVLSKIHKIFSSQNSEIKGVEFKDLINDIEKDDMYGQMFMGISSELKSFIWVNLIERSGFLVLGRQGAGKTVTLRNALVISQATMGDSVLQFLIDPSDKAMNAFSVLFSNL